MRKHYKVIVIGLLIVAGASALFLRTGSGKKRMTVREAVLKELKPKIDSWAAAGYTRIDDSPDFWNRLADIHIASPELLNPQQSQQLKLTVKNLVMAYHDGTFEAYSRFRIPVADFSLQEGVQTFLEADLRKSNLAVPADQLHLFESYFTRYQSNQWVGFWTGIALTDSFIEVQNSTGPMPALTEFVFTKMNGGAATCGPVLGFRVTPDAILQRRPSVAFATVSLLCQNNDVSCPVYCRFYWVEEYGKWLPIELVSAYSGPRKRTLFF